MAELRRIIEDSEIMAEDDSLWPQPGKKFEEKVASYKTKTNFDSKLQIELEGRSSK